MESVKLRWWIFFGLFAGSGGGLLIVSSEDFSFRSAWSWNSSKRLWTKVSCKL